jgi:hypothetical protein
MLMKDSTRKTISGICFSLSSVWGIAAFCKLAFGVQVAIFFLPPLGLERVAVLPSMAVTAGLLFIGARLGRNRESHDVSSGVDVPASQTTSEPAALSAPAPDWPIESPARAPVARRRSST